MISYTLQYSTTMNPATAGLSTNYQVYAYATEIVDRKRVTVTKAVRIKTLYIPSINSIALIVVGKNPFSTLGGEIKILASSAATGVSSEGGALLNLSDTVLKIRPGGVGITVE